VQTTSAYSENVLVVIPTYNEETYIEQCIRSLVADTDERVVFAVVDGMSQDQTVNIVAKLQNEFSNLDLIENPKRLQSAAVNLAADHYSHFESGYMVRCDAHSIYPPNFIRNIVARLDAEGTASVVVPMDAVGQTCFEKANAWIVDTPLGSGGAAHRGGTVSGLIDHGHHAGFDLQWFRKLGGYDETFSHNEDAEYDHRVIASGGSIFLDAETRIGYSPRGSASALLKQYYNYGKGRARTCRKHNKLLKIRQLLPIVLVIGIILSLLGGMLHPALLAPVFLYALLLLCVSAYMCGSKRSACALWSGLILACMHLGWGAGFLVQVLKPNNHKPKNSLPDIKHTSTNIRVD